MGLFGVLSALLSWLFRPSLVFAKLCEVYVSGQLLQNLDETFGAHLLKEAPLVFGDRDHHAIVGARQMACQVITGNLIGDLLFTVHAAQGGFDQRQDIVGEQCHAKPEQSLAVGESCF